METIQQMNQILEYFLKKLESSKQLVRNGSLKILNKLLQPANTLERNFSMIGENFQNNFDLNFIINNLKQLNTYENYIQPLLLDYFRRIILVETNPEHLNIYILYLITEIIDKYNKTVSELNFLNGNAESLYDSSKTNFNETTQYLANFFFKRGYFLNYINQNFDNWNKFGELLFELCKILFKINEVDSQSHLIKQQQTFTRSKWNENCYLVIQTDTKFYYMNEQLFNLIIFVTSLFGGLALDDLMSGIKILNVENFANALNEIASQKLLSINFNECQRLESYLVENLVNSYSNNILIKYLSKSYRLGTLSIYHILKKIDISIENNDSSTRNYLLNLNETDLYLIKNNIDKTKNLFSELRVASLINEIINESNKFKREEKEEFAIEKKEVEPIKLSNKIFLEFDKDFIKSKIKEYKSTHCKNIDKKINEMEISENETSSVSLINLLFNSNIENLETNLERFFQLLKNNSLKVQVLCDTISLIEKSDLKKEKKYLINILINYLCRFDSNIVNKKFNEQVKLVFEYRNSSLNFSNLISIFLHQANWQKIFDCCLNLIKKNNFFKYKIENFW